MPKICYTERKFSKRSMEIIDSALAIITEYEAEGYDLTLRQLYYQFVARDLLPNSDRSYKQLGSIISDARRAGLIDWNTIVDRTRFLRKPAAWDSPAELVEACADQFKVDWWENQPTRVEVWVEKDALVGVLEVACEPWNVPYFSCRGYVSDSEIWQAARRILTRHNADGQQTVILHLGDHDPSGIDMSRDILDRLRLFAGSDEEILRVDRIALTMLQIEEESPPPNPAKVTDSRFTAYQNEYGDESWELDSLDPRYITDLIASHIKPLIDDDEWARCQDREDDGRERLRRVAEGLSNG